MMMMMMFAVAARFITEAFVHATIILTGFVLSIIMSLYCVAVVIFMCVCNFSVQ